MNSVHHLPDDRLYDCYLSARGGERLDPPSAEHLADCSECAGRYAEMARLLETVSVQAAVEADAAFPPDRLYAQQQQIARRLQQIGRAARVISFPGSTPDAHAEAGKSPIVLKWAAAAAAAAAAGIVIGLGAGLLLESESRGAREVQQSAALTRPVRLAPATAVYMGSGEAADDRFMTELESALDRPRTHELAAFDALTPHVREVANVR